MFPLVEQQPKFLRANVDNELYDHYLSAHEPNHSPNSEKSEAAPCLRCGMLVNRRVGFSCLQGTVPLILLDRTYHDHILSRTDIEPHLVIQRREVPPILA